MPDSCDKEQICCPPNSLNYVSCESGNLFSASVTETFSCEGQPDVILTGRGVSSVDQADADAKAAADLELQLAIYRITNPCEEGCTESDLSQLTDCGAQNWPVGPQTGIPYSNTGDNVTDFITISAYADFVSTGTEITGGSGDIQVNQLPIMVGNSFTMTGTISMGWQGEGTPVNKFYWILLDEDNARAAGFGWSSVGLEDENYMSLVWCDLGADITATTPVSDQPTSLTSNTEHDFIFSYIGGTLSLQIDDEDPITIELGCALFGKVVLASNNQSGLDNLLTNISVT